MTAGAGHDQSFNVILTCQSNHPNTMLAKFDIDYITHPQHNKMVHTHRTDDPVAAVDFLTSLLAIGARISAIKHEGVELSQSQGDQMLGMAAQRLASGLLVTSLGLDAAEVKQRFGFAA